MRLGFTRQNFSMKNLGGFTLIELLIVIGIIAVLSTVVILIINPPSILKESRDATRLAEVASLDKAIGFSVAQNPSLNLGATNKVYISIPDSSPTCANVSNLRPLASGWSYNCVQKDVLKRVDGSGWVPISFQSLGVVPLDNLPTDKINDGNLGLYYTYATNGSNWEINAQMESDKYQWGGSSDKESSDGGDTIILFEKGSNLRVAPKEVNARFGYAITDSCLAVEFLRSSLGASYYPRWTVPVPTTTPVPGSKKVAVTKIMFYQGDNSFAPGELTEMAIYNDKPGYNIISEKLIMDGTGVAGAWA